MDGKLTGRLSAVGGLRGTLSPVGGLRGTLSLGSGTGIPYTGDYEVTPTFDEQYLYTNGKMMMDDVNVHKIPVVRTSNPQGGITVVIGVN